jgi:hypothetical protein
VHDLVLVRVQPQGHVLVRDAGQQVVRELGRLVHQVAGEGGHGPGQRLLLPAVRLVAAVEQPVQQLGVLAEHVRVEAPGDLLDVLPDHGQRGLDDGVRGV